MAKSEDELKNLLMKMKEESEKAGLKLNIQTQKVPGSTAAASLGNLFKKQILGLLHKPFEWDILGTHSLGF